MIEAVVITNFKRVDGWCESINSYYEFTFGDLCMPCIKGLIEGYTFCIELRWYRDNSSLDYSKDFFII